MAKSDLQRAYEALAAKQKPYTDLWQYYDGEQELRYISQRLALVFKDLDARFTQNWAAVVVDAEIERISLKEFTVPGDETAQTTLNELFGRTELNLDADDVHLAASVCGEAFVFAWREQGEATEAFYNDPRLCHLFYESENPRRKRFAAKWWIDDEDERRYLNLYYPDRIEYYASGGKAKDLSSFRGLKELQPPAANPYGVIPIFHFRPERRRLKSRLTNVIEPQDAINKLTADMMVSAEYGAMKQRWVVTNANIDTLKSSPGETWKFPAGDGVQEPTQVGEFETADLNNFLGAIDRLAGSIAIITRTPKHYLFQQGGDPSGEALIAMEAPLNKKAQKFIGRLKPTWVEMACFMHRLETGQEIDPAAVTALFDRPETVQPRTEAEIREINTRAGIPLKTTLRRQGWSVQDLDQLDEDAAEEETIRARSEASAFVKEIFKPGANANGNGTQPPAAAVAGGASGGA